MSREIKQYWGVFFTPAILDTVTFTNNSRVWTTLAIFEDMTEAMNYRKSVWMGNQTNKDGIQVKEVIVTFKD